MTRKPYITAVLTGSIGSGKSVASKIFENLGAVVVDADVLSREAVNPGSVGLQKVVEQFGAGFLNADGTLNRKKLGRVVFGSPEKRSVLEKILHPIIRTLAKQRKESFIKDRSSGQKVYIYVVPLFFEANLPKDEYDRIICISSSLHLCKERVITRDSLSEDEAEARLQAQLPIEEKERLSDIVIKNDGSLSELEQQVRTVYAQLLALTSN